MPGTVGTVDPLTALLALLAVARLTRLVTTDRVMDGPRRALVRRLGPEHPVAYLVMCDWCVSVYTGTGVAGIVWAWSGSMWLDAALLALAGSYVAGWLASHGEE